MILLFFVFLIMAPLSILAGLVSEELLVIFSMAMNLIVTMINLIIVVPIIKLATADVYRRLEERSAGATAQDLPDMQAVAGEVGATEG